MKTQFDIPLLESVYSQLDNYKIIENPKSNSNHVIIAFSGNGLYYPNEEHILQKKIIEEDYYEWFNILKNESSQYKKIIFVRDVRKTWYIDGINKTYNTIEKVFELLQQLTSDNDEIICVGNSAGGYAAVLFGCLLNAQKIFTISGYALLDEDIWNNPENPALKKAYHNFHNWYDLSNLIHSHSNNIFYFYPKYSTIDTVQSAFFSKFPIHIFPIDSQNHGEGPPGFLYNFFFKEKNDSLIKLSKKLEADAWTRQKLFKKYFGFKYLYYKLLYNVR